jgi:hypothetical protein
MSASELAAHEQSNEAESGTKGSYSTNEEKDDSCNPEESNYSPASSHEENVFGLRGEIRHDISPCLGKPLCLCIDSTLIDFGMSSQNKEIGYQFRGGKAKGGDNYFQLSPPLLMIKCCQQQTW